MFDSKRSGARGPRRLLRASALLLTLCWQAAMAAPPLTTIQDVLYKADGSRFEGYAYIQWQTFESANQSNIPTRNLSVRIRNGNLRVALVPTTNTSTGAYYLVKYNSGGQIQFTEYWAVPPSAVSLRIRDVRRILPPGSPTVPPPANTDVLPIAGVSGLRDELDLRPAKGPTYAASRAAVISSTGAIESAVGDPSDCIRVDGTAAPCESTAGPDFVDGETPSGSVDGVNSTFSLSAAPNPASSLQVFRNGILQKIGVDYSLNGSTVTFGALSIPSSGDILQVWFRH